MKPFLLQPICVTTTWVLTVVDSSIMQLQKRSITWPLSHRRESANGIGPFFVPHVALTTVQFNLHVTNSRPFHHYPQPSVVGESAVRASPKAVAANEEPTTLVNRVYPTPQDWQKGESWLVDKKLIPLGFTQHLQFVLTTIFMPFYPLRALSTAQLWNDLRI